MAALSATGQDAYHNFFFPFVDGFVFAKANDFADILSKMTDDVCAVMLETGTGRRRRGSSGQRICSGRSKSLQGKRHPAHCGRSTDRHGQNRLRSATAVRHSSDLVPVAKDLGGGIPIGAVLFGEKTETVFVPGDHGSTFGGNPVVCAGAVHILNTMDDAFLQDVQKKGTYLKEKIEKMPHVQNVARPWA